MDTRLPRCALLSLALTAFVCLGASEQGSAEALFRSAFEADVRPVARVEILERVAKDYPDSAWADDALWVLGEAARRQGIATRVMYYWQYLVSRWPEVELEEFTRSLPLYRRSKLPGILYLVKMEGKAYQPTRARVVSEDAGSYAVENVEVFNPAPVLVWEGLAESYARMDRPRLAARAYRQALDAAPEEGDWADRFRKRVEAKRERMRLLANARTREDARSAGGAEEPPREAEPAEPGPKGPSAEESEEAEPSEDVSAQ